MTHEDAVWLWERLDCFIYEECDDREELMDAWKNRESVMSFISEWADALEAKP